MFSNSWFKKESPLLGLFGSGGGLAQGKSADASGGTVLWYDTDGTAQPSDPESTDHLLSIGDKLAFLKCGMYKFTMDGSQTFRCHVWGAGGGKCPNPGPATGGAGGGVRGTFTFGDTTVLTLIIGGGGRGTGGSYPGNNGVPGSTGSGGFPNGGGCPGYNGFGGGGYSYIAEFDVPFGNRDVTPVAPYMRLIGGGGGGGIGYTNDSGEMNAQGGYPTGIPGGGYYNADAAGCVGGGGGTASGGTAGTAGREPAGEAGSQFQGGRSGSNGGGGGGGGWYGGGGAGGYYAMGGGGSGYIHPTASDTASFTATPGEPSSFIAIDDPTYPVGPADPSEVNPFPANFARGDVPSVTPTVYQYPSPQDNGRGLIVFERTG